MNRENKNRLYLDSKENDDTIYSIRIGGKRIYSVDICGKIGDIIV